MNGNWLSRSSFTPIMRKHITMPQHWAFEAGTDFWLLPGPDMNTAEDTGSQQQLPEWGWTSTSLVDTAGSAADFISSDDRGIPNHILTNASSDLLESPAIFGDYSHAKQAQDIAGQKGLPTDLILDAIAAFTVSSNDDQGTGFGFAEDGGTIITEADQIAAITSDGTNFQLAANGGAGALTDAGAVVDTTWNSWRIRINLADQLVYWYKDGTLQGSVALTTDQFPAKFGMGVEGSSTGNRVGLGIVHIWYSWNDWR